MTVDKIEVGIASVATAILLCVLIVGYAPFSPFSPFEGLWMSEIDIYDEIGKLRTYHGYNYAIYEQDWNEWTSQVEDAGGELESTDTWEEFKVSLENRDVTLLKLDEQERIVWYDVPFTDQTIYFTYAQRYARPSLPILLFVALSFFPSLIVLTPFFSQILSGRIKRRSFWKSAFLVSFAGLTASTVFALAAPLLPGLMPFLDLGVAFAGLTWVLLLRYYCGTSWLESLPPSFIAVIIYVAIFAIASGFSRLLLAE
jgi:hypothetical protein